MTSEPMMDQADRSRDYEYVTVLVGGQLFGLPIEDVHDVFLVANVTPVPLAGAEVVGLINLRGRIVTAISLRRRLRLPEGGRFDMAVGIEFGGESFGLAVDTVGEVLRLPVEDREPNPINLDAAWSRLSKGVHRLPEGLLIILDIAAVLDFETDAIAA